MSWILVCHLTHPVGQKIILEYTLERAAFVRYENRRAVLLVPEPVSHVFRPIRVQELAL